MLQILLSCHDTQISLELALRVVLKIGNPSSVLTCLMRHVYQGEIEKLRPQSRDKPSPNAKTSSRPGSARISVLHSTLSAIP